MPKIGKSTTDAKAKKRMQNERNLTIIMMLLIGNTIHLSLFTGVWI